MAYDFYANMNYTIVPGEICKIWTDVKAYMNDDEGLIINVRSSMGGKFMLANKRGDRIAQGIFIKKLPADSGNIDIERIGGFGSTNK